MLDGASQTSPSRQDGEASGRTAQDHGSVVKRGAAPRPRSGSDRHDQSHDRAGAGVTRPALSDGHLQRVEPQLRAQVVGHCPANDPPAEGIQHHGAVEEAGRGRYVGDVGHPQRVRRLGQEIAVDRVWGGTRLLIAPGRDGTAAPMAGADEAGLAHRPSDALPRMPLALLAQVGVDMQRALGWRAPRWTVRIRFSSAATAIARADGFRPTQASYPPFDTPRTRAMAATGKSAWFALMNRKTPTAELRSPAQTRPSRARARGCRAPTSAVGSHAAAARRRR